MPKYLWHAHYTSEGAKGVLKEGGSGRRAAVKEVVEKAGGKLEAFYFAFGESDAIVIADLPDAQTAAAISMTVAAGGVTTIKTTVLLTPEDLDAAAKKSVQYRAPGR